MSKILQFTAGVFAAIAICGMTSGNEPNNRVLQWTPTSTSNQSEFNSSGSQTSSRQILPSLRALEPSQMRNVRVERAMPLQTEQSDADESKITQFLDEGDALMAQRRWYDAKKRFESGLRSYPDNITLRSRLAQARRRQEIEIRYQDATFTSLTANVSISDLLLVFDEVLQDVDRYHVDCPAYAELFELGAAGVAEALSEESFFTQNKLDPTKRTLAQETFKALHEKAAGVPLATREDMRRVVLWAARQLRKYADVPETATISEFLCSAVCSLDAYSSSLTPVQVEDVFSLIDGRFVGLGVELKTDAPTKVVRVIPRSPAEEAGVVVGDEIVSIDGSSTTSLTGAEIGELLQGQEGEKSTLLLRGTDGELRKVVAVRRAIDVPSVENIHVLDAPGQIGYVKISCFQKTTAEELSNAIDELSRQQIQSLVVDLRQNPGGLLQEAINVSDVFLDSGTIVQTRGRNGRHTFQAKGERVCSLPLILLVDNNSASAAEIFAGAMQENNRAVIVGSQSYGKGTVQAIVQLSCNTLSKKPIAGLRLTTEKFYSPKGRAYAGVGVLPNVDLTDALNAAESLEGRIAPTQPAYADQAVEEPAAESQTNAGYGYIPAGAKRRDAVPASEVDSDVYLSAAVREALKLQRVGFERRSPSRK